MVRRPGMESSCRREWSKQQLPNDRGHPLHRLLLVRLHQKHVRIRHAPVKVVSARADLRDQVRAMRIKAGRRGKWGEGGGGALA